MIRGKPVPTQWGPQALLPAGAINGTCEWIHVLC